MHKLHSHMYFLIIFKVNMQRREAFQLKLETLVHNGRCSYTSQPQSLFLTKTHKPTLIGVFDFREGHVTCFALAEALHLLVMELHYSFTFAGRSKR